MTSKKGFSWLDTLFGRGQSSWLLPEPLARPARFCYLASQEFQRNHCSQTAATLAFETIFALVPTIVLSLFLVRSFGGLSSLGRDIPVLILHQLNADEIHLSIPQPGAGAEAVHVKLSDKIQEIIEDADLALRSHSVSLIFLASLFLAAMAVALTLERSLNDIWGGESRRSLIHRISLYWGILTLGPFLVALSIYVARWLHAPTGYESLGVRMLGPVVALLLVYRLAPAATVRKKSALLGAVIAATAWETAKFGFAFYLRNAVGYGKIYGNLGLLPIFLIWVWVGWIIVLGGAEVAYTFQNLTWLTAVTRRRLAAPVVQPAWAALNIVLHAGRAFRAGQGPAGAAELEQAAGLPHTLWTRIRSALVARGILMEAGPYGEALTPGRPLEDLRVEEIFTAMEDAFATHAAGQDAV